MLDISLIYLTKIKSFVRFISNEPNKNQDPNKSERGLHFTTFAVGIVYHHNKNNTKKPVKSLDPLSTDRIKITLKNQ